MEDVSEAEEQGIACALGKICSLESRLRDAIQSTHSLHRSFGRDLGAVDRERASLLVIREHLEGLEDKLRDYKTAVSDPKLYDEKAIALSQMDTYRKDLLRASRDRVDEVLFNKDVVKDILAFADTGAGDGALPEVPYDAMNGRPDSPVPSLHSSEGTDNSAFTGEFSDAGSYLTRSNSVSPYGSRKDSYGYLTVPTGQENAYPFPPPSASLSAPQPKREHIFGEQGIYGGHSLSDRCSRSNFLPYDLGSELVAASHASQENLGIWSLKPSKGPRSEQGSLASSYTQSGNPMKIPSSHQGSSPSPHGSLGNGHAPAAQPDVPFGGKLSFKAKEEREAGAKPPAMPLSPVPKSEPPRVLNDPSYSETSSGTDRPVSEESKASFVSHEGSTSIQPNRIALEKRAALQRAPAQPHRRFAVFPRVWAGFMGLAARPVQAGKHVTSQLSLDAVAAWLIGGATALTISKAVYGQKLPHRTFPPKLRPKQRHQQRYVRRLRADGALVPDWMHRSQFKTSDSPPVGALTSTAGPPQGEMFPVIPPPSTRYTKG